MGRIAVKVLDAALAAAFNTTPGEVIDLPVEYLNKFQSEGKVESIVIRPESGTTQVSTDQNPVDTDTNSEQDTAGNATDVEADDKADQNAAERLTKVDSEAATRKRK